MRSSPIEKCTRLRCVCAPQYRSAGTSISPIESVSRRIPVAGMPIAVSCRVRGIEWFIALPLRRPSLSDLGHRRTLCGFPFEAEGARAEGDDVKEAAGHHQIFIEIDHIGLISGR